MKDQKWMKVALGLAQRGLGNVAPNPAVGCLIVKGGIVLGRGWTQPGGRPHAETEALRQAGKAAAGATAYVTLEPCAHYGQTPPCAEALVKAGIKRVVVAVTDRDHRVSGKGLAILEEAGIEVQQGVLCEEASVLNAGFFLKVRENRPLFSLKIAESLDGRIATATGESKWITGLEARHYGHMLRAKHDAILVGVNTVLADDPDLTCRLPGMRDLSPVRIILDSQLKTPLSAKLFGAQTAPVWIVADKGIQKTEQAQALAAVGARLCFVENTKDLPEVARVLADAGLTRVLVEGGGSVHASFMKAGLADRLHVFTAGKVIGADGIAAIGGLGLAELAHAPHFKLASYLRLGADLLATYEKAG